MALITISTPEKTVNGILSNANAGLSQLPYSFLEDDLAGKLNYKVNIEIRDDAGAVALVPLIFRYSPRPHGELFIDVGKIITGLQKEVQHGSLYYLLWYQETFEGFEGIPTATPTIQSIFAYKQLLDIGGSNMYDYLLNDDTSKLLTKFKNPIIWCDWLRTVYFVIDDNYQNRFDLLDLNVVQQGTDINKGLIGAPTITPFPIEASLQEYVFQSEDVGSKFQRVFLQDNSGVQISEFIYYERRVSCEPQIMLQWRNSLGGYDQHLFMLDTLFNRNVTEGLTGQKSIEEDIENVARTETRIPLHWFQEAILTEENLTFDQVRALQEIKSSPQVSVYLDKAGTKQVFVVVNNLFATEDNNKDTNFDLSVQIKFPNDFDFATGKLY